MPSKSAFRQRFAALAALAVGTPAHADEAKPPDPPAAPAAAAPAPAVADAAPAPDLLDPAVYADLTDEQILALASDEVIVVWDERPDKPFDRDTTLRLTDADLVSRGVGHLGHALALVPELHVRTAGRGGQILDIRGARRGAVRVLVDGIPLEDPYYGTFDLSSIPLTDIVQVRVATSPSSPIDGPGGPGGVVEVHTRDAVGDRLVIGRASGDTLPTAGASATGRGRVAPDLGVRASVTGTLGDHHYAVPGATLDEDEHFAGGAMRVEWRPARQQARRAVLDVAGYHRGFLVPPAEEDVASITVVDRDTGARVTAGYDDRVGELRVAARAHGYLQARLARYYRDASMTEETDVEDLTAHRAGASLLVNRPVRKTMQLVAAAHLATEAARVGDLSTAVTEGRSTVGELAAGWQYEDGPVRIDGAAGVAVPVGVGEAPWPEAKLVAAVRPVDAVTFTATAARKGRLPTLRERYRLDVGNAALDPEHTSFGELKVGIAPSSRLSFELAGWARRQSGMIRLDGPTRMLVNLGVVDFVGIDARAEVRPVDAVTLTAAWSYVDADDATPDPPLDFLPPHRVIAQARVVPHATTALLVRVRWTDEQIDQRDVLAPYASWEAEATWSPTPRWAIAARGEDLLDRRWPLQGDVRSPGRTLILAIQGELH